MPAEDEEPQTNGSDLSDDEEWPPLYDEAEFEEFVNRLVALEQPRAFALVAELGVRVDAQVIGWGLQFAEHVDVQLTDGRTRLSFSTLERVVRVLSSRGTVRVVYLPVDTPPDDD